MQPLIQSYTSWQPLEEVVVGRVFTPEYFGFIRDADVRSSLERILEETNEDLDNLQTLLENYGATVRRPDLPELEGFLHAQTMPPTPGFEAVDQVPIPPLTPRDWQITLGEKLLRVLRIPEMDSVIDIYDQSQVVNPHGDGYDETHPIAGAVASCIVRVGEDVFFDNSEYLTDANMAWIRDHVLDHRYRVHRAQTNGHGDSVFAILRPGVIVSSLHDADINYAESFPGWEVCKVWDPTIWAAMEVGKFKVENFNDRWYVQGQEPSAAFARYVDTYLSKWTGYVRETVFDVNCLVLDEQHVVFSGYNKTVFDFCEQHGITPIISELRHKYFFDGGISCCTQDIRRRGSLERYL